MGDHRHRALYSIDDVGGGVYWHLCRCGKTGSSPLKSIRRRWGGDSWTFGRIRWGVTMPEAPPVPPGWSVISGIGIMQHAVLPQLSRATVRANG